MKKVPVAGIVLLSLALLQGCSKETRINLLATIERDGGEVPISNIKFEILPYNPEKLKETLFSLNDPGELPARDSMLVARSKYEEILVDYEETLDRLEETEKKLKSIEDTRSAAYRTAFNKHEKAKQINDEMYEKKEEILREYLAEKAAYDSLVGEWEEVAYEGMQDSIAAVRERRKITTDYTIKTDKEGKGSIVVPGGDWWIVGRARNPNQKYTYYVWNEKISAEGGTVEVHLDSSKAKIVEE